MTSIILGSPFAKLNLLRNPFGELTRSERVDFALVDGQRWQELLRNPLAVLQFIGPCGHGKTTHLLALQRTLPQSVYVYLPEDGPMPRIPKSRPLLLDEAQRLSWYRRWHVFRQPGTLVLGTHTDLSRSLVRAGRHVVTVQVAKHQSEDLQTMFERRIEGARRGPGLVPLVSPEEIVRLQQTYGADVRAMEGDLYQQFQKLAWESTTWRPAN